VASLTELYLRCRRDPQWESAHVSKRPLRGPQAEIVKRVEQFVTAHEGGVMTILSSRQTGKNETGAILQRRHLWRRQYASLPSIWIRTAPTYKPQIVNSKKRLREILALDAKKRIRHPLFNGQKLIQEEGYIWRLGNASVEFVSSGPQANVVGATASECLDMDEAHKVDKAKFDEDFAPFTASTNAATLLWGVAANGLDTIEAYRKLNIEAGRPDLNLYFPCEIWREFVPTYAAHLDDRISKLGWDHPIIKTQYRLIPVAAEGRFLQPNHLRTLFSGDHERVQRPRHGVRYELMIDIAAGNEDFNPDADFEGEEDTKTDSTVIWVYEVSPILSTNGVFPIVRLVNLHWFTGVPLPKQEGEIKSLIEFWNPEKVTIDAVGVGRQIAEAMAEIFGDAETSGIVHKYVASDTSVSEDCFDLQARLNFNSVTMFRDDGSPEWAEFERQCGWTLYSSANGKMKLIKPKGGKKHIDMVKGLTYMNRNSPAAGMHEIYKVEGHFV
jgi:hypothetical protein